MARDGQGQGVPPHTIRVNCIELGQCMYEAVGNTGCGGRECVGDWEGLLSCGQFPGAIPLFADVITLKITT